MGLCGEKERMCEMESIALIGNPNCGKTTLFNRLTGERAHVGNWPGVTVERREGLLRNQKMTLVDLPGLYSLTVFSPEEAVSRDFLLEGHPALNLLEGRTLDRGLYLTMQLLELGCPVTVVIAQEQGGLDCKTLSRMLGVPVLRAEDPALSETLIFQRARFTPRYGRILEGYAAEASSVLSQNPPRKGSLRFWAIAALEGSPPACTKEQQRRLEEIRARMEKRTGKEADAYIAGERYGLIEKMLQGARPEKPGRKEEKADRLLLHRVLALPCFFLVMAALFWLCFGSLGQALQQMMERLVTRAGSILDGLLELMEVSQHLRALLCDGVLGGVGTVLCFLPQLALLFFGMSFLEESGYLARAAFLTDHPLRRIGLSGRAFVPLLMGFGCTTTAIMSTRTLRGGERKDVVRMLPYCSCGAKFPIYALFAGTFFPSHPGLAVAGCYFLGIAAGAVQGRLSAKNRPKTDFLLELPGYRLPSPVKLWNGTWEKCADFLRKAGTVIFLMSVSVWLLRHMALTPAPVFVPPDESLLSVFADRIAPMLKPLGFGTREAAVALLTGVAGKEAVVSTLGVLCETGGSTVLLTTALQSLFTPLSAASFLVFCALYTPCVSALAAIGRELSPLSAMGVALRQTALAYLASLTVYQLGVIFTQLISAI